MPTQDGTAQEAWSIFLVGAEARTLAKKWIHQWYQD